ncbi:hypothetical protein [Methylocucumis oryzae]|uniref:hypothetical protein n=1 Tax=Methylocucumis oryzae TaxID=1632867 RepID=UPI0012FED7F4|nr:hypothetical protein [Methylocucumis oryzae]
MWNKAALIQTRQIELGEEPIQRVGQFRDYKPPSVSPEMADYLILDNFFVRLA